MRRDPETKNQSLPPHVIESLLQRQSAQLGIVLNEANIAALVKFAALIAKWNRRFNLVGSSKPDDLVRNHIVDCLAATPFIDGKRVVDVGAGAGFPGIVIALMRPQSNIILVESSQRKSRFLTQVAIELSLRNVEVVCERVENWEFAQPIDCVVCRGYGSLRKFYDDTRALHPSGCRLVALKASLNDAEITELQLDPESISLQVLEVPDWDHRHLVTITPSQ